jgi:hypothetical protein
MTTVDQILEYVNALIATCGGNPVCVLIGVFAVTLIRLGVIKLPVNVPLLSPTAETDGHDSLRDRLSGKVVDRFSELLDAGHDADDAYTFLVNQVRTDPKAEAPKGVK